ncbi:MAG: hypothetical protein H7Y61_08790 [Rhizobiales bacterium]|nr:hypothetical protein [Rhizobacter sp.]
MPVITEHAPVNPAVLNDPRNGWRRMIRIDTVGAAPSHVIRETMALLPDKLVYAEGDSWFDKFTPLGRGGTNLLQAIRTPFHAAVVDVSNIGDEVRNMVSGRQARQTRAMFELFDFDAILLSAGGNDLKNVFATLFDAKAERDRGVRDGFARAGIDMLAAPAGLAEAFDETVANIGRFVDLRNGAGRERTRATPLFVHGYDYLQPRPAGAEIFSGSGLGGGPWIYPSLLAAGLSDADMLAATRDVIDEFNNQLARRIAILPNVHLIDQRGLLTPGLPKSTGESNDWLDEIHPTEAGFEALARQRWDAPLSMALGWMPAPGDTA